MSGIPPTRDLQAETHDPSRALGRGASVSESRLNGDCIDIGVEARVFEIGEEYLDQLHAGEPPSAAWLITSQPEHAPYLERHLALVELLFRAGISQDGGLAH